MNTVLRGFRTFNALEHVSYLLSRLDRTRSRPDHNLLSCVVAAFLCIDHNQLGTSAGGLHCGMVK